MAQLLPYNQIGENLYAESGGRTFNIDKGGFRRYVQSPFETSTQKLNQAYDMRRKNEIDLLKQQQSKATAGFNRQKTELKPVYQNQRNQADVVNNQNVSRLRELMAANGINASGENVTASANLASARQTSLNDITNNENQAIKEIDRQIADVNDPTQERAIIQAIEAERAREMAEAWERNQQQIYQQTVDWRDYAMQKAQFDWEMAQKKAAAAAKASGGGGGGSRGGRKKSSKSSSSSSKSSAEEQMTLAQQYAQYAKLRQLEQKHAPARFQPAQSKARAIF